MKKKYIYTRMLKRIHFHHIEYHAEKDRNRESKIENRTILFIWQFQFYKIFSCVSFANSLFVQHTSKSHSVCSK